MERYDNMTHKGRQEQLMRKLERLTRDDLIMTSINNKRTNKHKSKVMAYNDKYRNQKQNKHHSSNRKSTHKGEMNNTIDDSSDIKLHPIAFNHDLNNAIYDKTIVEKPSKGKNSQLIRRVRKSHKTKHMEVLRLKISKLSQRNQRKENISFTKRHKTKNSRSKSNSKTKIELPQLIP